MRMPKGRRRILTMSGASILGVSMAIGGGAPVMAGEAPNTAQLAPVSRGMIFNYVAERALGLPRSY